jgi:hypothetical protein
MPDTLPSYPKAIPSIASVTTTVGGVIFDAQHDVTISGDAVGRDQIMAGSYILRLAKWCPPSYQLTHRLLNRIPAVVGGRPVRRIAVLGTV